MSKPARLVSAASLCAVIALAVGACVYNPDQPCGPAMHFVEATSACVCNSDAVAVAGGCKMCAADEVPAAGQCACPTGQTKNENNVCVKVGGLGDACDTATAPCSDATYAYCATRGGGTAGTCTRLCTGKDDCDAPYTCATWESQPYCRTFTDLGKSCAAPADCAGDANLCDTLQSHACVVSGCDLVKNDCPRGLTCTDFSAYGFPTVCAGAP